MSSRRESSCAPGRPRVDSVRPLSRCPRAPRSARANSTPVDSCRLMSIRPLTHAAPHARPRRAEPPQSRVDRNRVARQADRPFLDPSAPSRWSRWSRLSRAGPEGAAGGAREVIESAEARHASGAFLPLHLSGVSSWVASRDHRDFQDDRDGPVAQAAPESIRPLTHASPHARGPSRPPSSRRAAPEPSRQESTGVDRNRVARRAVPEIGRAHV